MQPTGDVDIVARFQERFGREAALVRARTFMADYLSLNPVTLSPVSLEALRIVKSFIAGQASEADLAEMRARCWKYLGPQDEEHKKPDRPSVRAALCLLSDNQSAGEDIDYLIEFFMGWVDQTENHADQFRPLLELHFLQP